MDVDGGDGGQGRRRRYILGGIALIVVVGGAFLLMQGGTFAPSGPSDTGGNQSDPFETYGGGTEDAATSDVGDAEIAATVEIGEFSLAPSRPIIEVGQAVRWENTNNFPVRLEFDESSQSPTIEAGGTLELRFRKVTHYTVYNANTGEEITGGSIGIAS